jgi:penicillin amidase
MSFLDSVVGPLARSVLVPLSRRSLPQTSGILVLPGLEQKVEILRDRWGIPHIFAQTAHDLFFSQGFVHAQDRLFQMEMNRRTAQGRLSELFGPLALDTDRAARVFGFERLGKADLENAAPDLRQVMQSYAAGVNAFLSHPASRLPVEFTLLGHRPEPWRAEDSTAFARVMIWQLSHAWYSEVVRAQVVEKIGAERAADLETHYPQHAPLVLPRGIEFNRIDAGGVLMRLQGPFLDQGKGSNSWAITGRKSATGSAVLCNDMHLALKLPSIWYEVHLDGAGLQVTGVSLPGVPMVLVGHNARIAWGITLAFTDAEDLYVEKFDENNPTRYQAGGEWLEAQVIREPIRVKGQKEPHIENVCLTRHGPVISDVIGYPQQRVAVQSMALRPCPTMQGWLRLDQAQGWDDFVEAMRLIEAPQLSIDYADVEGNIGYWCTGKVPVRAKGDGSLPAPGWGGEYEWVGEVPFAEMPHALNPEQGYVVHTNNKIVPDDYPHFLGNAWMNGYRARRIVDILESKEKLSAEDFRNLHVDFTCLPGLEFVRRLEGLQSQDPDVQLALTYLRGWDGDLGEDSVAGSVYQVARYTLLRNLLDPALGPELALQVMGMGFHPLLYFSHEMYGHDTLALFRMLDDPDSWWLQAAGGWQAALERSLKQAVEWLRKELGADDHAWQWGKLHVVVLAHPLSLQKPLDAVFNRGPFPIGGDTDTPCQTAVSPAEPYANNAWAPSFRQIVDLGDLSRSQAVYPPGQSGQVGSPHYDDLLQLWLKGEYHPMLWTRQQVEEHCQERLALHKA